MSRSADLGSPPQLICCTLDRKAPRTVPAISVSGMLWRAAESHSSRWGRMSSPRSRMTRATASITAAGFVTSARTTASTIVFPRGWVAPWMEGAPAERKAWAAARSCWCIAPFAELASARTRLWKKMMIACSASRCASGVYNDWAAHVNASEPRGACNSACGNLRNPRPTSSKYSWTMSGDCWNASGDVSACIVRPDIAVSISRRGWTNSGSFPKSDTMESTTYSTHESGCARNEFTMALAKTPRKCLKRKVIACIADFMHRHRCSIRSSCPTKARMQLSSTGQTFSNWAVHATESASRRAAATSGPTPRSQEVTPPLMSVRSFLSCAITAVLSCASSAAFAAVRGGSETAEIIAISWSPGTRTSTDPIPSTTRSCSAMSREPIDW
mmetsp:Transcript_26527/g.63386  ORF Transcript_26527/g.63386 Transcript_26527/m.63386 type:complete len:386 (-) Transcript_26527:1799-2956(-)